MADIIDALYNRFSARAFSPRAVTKETLLKIFEAAARTPSWANSQPWEVFVAGGEVLNNLRSANVERFRSGAPRALDMPAPPKWPEEIQARMDLNMAERLRTLGIEREDREARRELSEHNYTFFNAPVVAFLCMDKNLTSWSAFDMGAFSLSIVLASFEYGVDSIPAITMAAYPDLIREALDIPPELTVLFSIALGYRDEDNALNRFRSIRRPVDEIVRFRGI